MPTSSAICRKVAPRARSSTIPAFRLSRSAAVVVLGVVVVLGGGIGSQLGFEAEASCPGNVLGVVVVRGGGMGSDGREGGAS